MSIDGVWTLRMDSPMGELEAALTIASADDGLTGSLTMPMGAIELTGEASGDAFSLAGSLETPMGEMRMEFEGTVDGDTASGIVRRGRMGEGAWTAARGAAAVAAMPARPEPEALTTEEMRRLSESWEEIHHTEAGPAGVSRELRGRMGDMMRARTALGPAPGEPAPDFDLPLLNGDGERVRLSDRRGRPVALIFGSYT